MTHIEYFKLQAKNLFKDYKTKSPYFDNVIDDYLYEYNPKYFDIEEIIMAYDLDEDDFTLMNAQHIIALMIGFKKWTDLLKASEAELELAKLLFDNQDKIHLEDWEMYIAGAERDNNTTFEPESRLEIFKHIFLEGNFKSPFSDYRLKKQRKHQKNKPNSSL
ncbi:MAG: hypothetical protein SFW66_09810 [Gammaproteobacteria bacterium]|nr:hypothetical protein [Gammaproteobacteria bacterium]